jgi:polyisoprenoid-binding protein YceI
MIAAIMWGSLMGDLRKNEKRMRYMSFVMWDKKRIFLSCFVCIFAVVVFTATSCPSNAAETYTIDASRTSVKIAIRKLGVSMINGVFSEYSGTINFDKDSPQNDSLDITIGVASLKTGDSDRDALMKSDEYFDAKKHPTMIFKSTRFRQTDSGKWEITGDFSLHGVKKSITVELESIKEKLLANGDSRITLRTQFTVRRNDYGIRKNIPLISDKVKINLVIEAAKK